MVIDWKATVQRTVTKSTTELELLSISFAGSQMAEWIRFFNGISFRSGVLPTIYCDNQQTVGIVNKDLDRLHTKLRHVDIHQMWIRQEAEAQRLIVKWVPTNKMAADGLTKILPKVKHQEFIRQLHLINIAQRLHGSIDDDNTDFMYPV